MYEPDKEWFASEMDDPLAIRMALDHAVSAIETSPSEQGRIVSTIVDLALYSGRPFSTIQMSDLWTYSALVDQAAIRFNAAYSVVSTILSRICSFRPRAQFIPRAGDYKTQRLCRDRTAASDAWAQREQYQDQASYAFRDCLTGSGGVLKTYQETCYEGTSDERTVTRFGRFPSWELKVDDEDGKYGHPECMYHVRYISQQAALKFYGKTDNDRTLILAGADRLATMEGYVSTDGLNGLAWRNGKRMVRVVDAYARGPRGRRAIMVGDFMVAMPAAGLWKHDWHPFDVMRFDKAEGTGFWGRSALDKVRGIQTGVDETIYEIDQAHHLSAKLFCCGPSAPEKMTNEIVQYLQDMPNRPYTFHNPKPIDPDAYRWFEMKKSWMFEVLGVSVNAAQATKPMGVTAAVAIDAVTDIQSDRLSPLSQMWEQVITTVAEKWYAFEDGSDNEYDAIESGNARTVKAHADGKRPDIRVFPTSLFGQSVPAMLQKAMDAVKAGWFDQEEIMKVLGVPDLEAVYKIKLAEYEWIENFADKVLEDGFYETPTVWANPIKMFDYCRLRYLRADTDGSYPAANMANMRKLLDYLQPVAQSARDKAAGKAPEPTPGAAAAPPAAPSPLSAVPATPAAPPLPGLTQSPEAPPIAA